jgi:hypothetical protein
VQSALRHRSASANIAGQVSGTHEPFQNCRHHPEKLTQAPGRRHFYFAMKTWTNRIIVPSAPQHTPVTLAGQARAVLGCDFSRYQYGEHTTRRCIRSVERSVVGDQLGIENHEVRPITRRNATDIDEPDSLCRKRRHPPHGLLEPEQPLRDWRREEIDLGTLFAAKVLE